MLLIFNGLIKTLLFNSAQLAWKEMVEFGKILYTWIVRIAIVTAINRCNFALTRYWLHLYQLREQHSSPLTPQAQSRRLPSCTVNRESLEVTLIPRNTTKPGRSGGLFLPFCCCCCETLFKSRLFLHMCIRLVNRSSLGWILFWCKERNFEEVYKAVSIFIKGKFGHEFLF